MRRHSRTSAALLLGVTALWAGAFSGCALEGSLDEFLDSPALRQPRTTMPGAGIDARTIYERASRAVVTVIAEYGPDGAESIGTGFAVGDDRTIVTNTHVVLDPLDPGATASGVFVQNADGLRREARILGIDPHADVAVLRAERPITQRALRFTDEAAEIADPVMAIGSPLGQTYTMSLGYVTGVDRRISGLAGFSIYGAIQTDAVITMGNSGGPLLNARGEVIGVNGQMLTVGGGGEGLGFAIPASLVERSYGYLRREETVPYAYLGVNGKPLWPGAGESTALPDGPGVLVGEVEPGSPAAVAGLRGGRGSYRFQGSDLRLGGDLITAIDGHRLRYNEQLGEALLRFRPGETVTLSLVRDGTPRQARVTLGERPVRWPSVLEMFFG